ncbi:hypothetical protein [Ideonella sp. BN130291]|uniref:hypothetical protein n=1 Tax=Ideonella sp. BN130291 TaxID=3112940 RepID=UPI002E26D220|nr:hypothetical protein [Ideonella sp. BN130291]
MTRLLAPVAALSLVVFAAMPMIVDAATSKKPAAKPAATKKKAEPKPVAAEPPETLSEGQLAMAGRVFTGRADCEFKQAVDVQPVDGRPGHFQVSFGKQRFDMVPEETTTGAVRLHDRKADVVWLQIPVKSMLMNNKAAQRMVDACQHTQQRAAVEAIEQARVAAAAADTAASAATNAASAAVAGSLFAGQPSTAAVAAAAQTAASAAAVASQAASAAATAASAAVSVSLPASSAALQVAPAASAPASAPAQ